MVYHNRKKIPLRKLYSYEYHSIPKGLGGRPPWDNLIWLNIGHITLNLPPNSGRITYIRGPTGGAAGGMNVRGMMRESSSCALNRSLSYSQRSELCDALH